jgi:phosphoribosylglycinamide formyltransferase-1
MMNIAVFASGGGSNLQAIYEAIRAGNLPNVNLSLVISNNSKSGALEFAKARGVNWGHLSLTTSENDDKLLERNMLQTLEENNIDLIVLAGYMKKLPGQIVKKYENRIINIHPALLPKYGGEGMYGLKVHEAVLASGDKETGASVHYVTNDYDEGEIIMQERCVVLANDTPESLQNRVKEIEHVLLPKAITLVAQQ